MDKPKKIAVTVACLAVMGLAVLSITRSCSGANMDDRINLADGYGEVVAEKIAVIATPDSSVLVLALESPHNATPARQAAILSDSLRKLGFANVAEETITGEQVHPMVIMEGHTLSAHAFENALRDHPDTQVVISMAGTPEPTDETKAFFSNGSARLILAANVAAGTNLNLWEQTDALAMTVLPRLQPPQDLTRRPPKDLNELFDFYFEILQH